MTRTATTNAPVFEARNLSLLRNRKALLHELHFQLHAGEFVALIGPNGAGKSSLVRAMTGEWPACGELRFFGQARGDWPRRTLARRIAVMPQQSILSFDFSVREVISMGRLPHRHLRASDNAAQVDAVMQELALHDFAERAFTTLSGGERQRVQFARALAQIAGNETEALLILDEPTAALDLAQQTAVLGIARKRAAQGASVLAVVHDLNLAARHADRVLVMKAGRLHADGSVHDIYHAAGLSESFGVEITVEHAACDGAPMVIPHAQHLRERASATMTSP